MEKQIINVGFTFQPNILHAGFFVALKKGYYLDEGLHIKYIWPKNENQSVQEDVIESINDLSNKKVDIIFGTFNSVVYHNFINNRIPLVALCGLTQRNIGSVAVLKKSHIESPNKLGGRKVGVVGLPFEQGFIDQMIKSEGGKERIQPVVTPFQHLLRDLREEKYDACHLVVPWHGVKAQEEKVELRMFNFEKYGIPQHYPVLISLKQIISEKKSLLQCFLRATCRGYQELIDSEPRKIAMILYEFNHEEMKDIEFLEKSIKCFREYIQEGPHWGVMEEEDWRNYVHFLSEKQLLRDEHNNPIKEEHVPIKSLFDNELLDLGSDFDFDSSSSLF